MEDRMTLLTIPELAERLRLSPSTMRSRVFRDRIGIRTIKVGKRVLVPADFVDRFLERRSRDAGDAPSESLG